MVDHVREMLDCVSDVTNGLDEFLSIEEEYEFWKRLRDICIRNMEETKTEEI